MTDETSSLNEQVKRLNENLEKALNKDRYFIYSASPVKFFFYNFFSGIAHSVGRTLGMLVVLAVLGFFAVRVLSQIDLTKAVADWLQGILSQVTPVTPGGR